MASEPTVQDVRRLTTRRHDRAYTIAVVDTTSSYEFGELRAMPSTLGRGALLVYDVTSAESFADLGEYYEYIRRTRWPSKVPVVLVANKIDLAAVRVVSRTQGAARAAEWACPYFEVSA
ncbi:small GTPase superfamily, partial [Thamnocephalis sphaerospora]